MAIDSISTLSVMGILGCCSGTAPAARGLAIRNHLSTLELAVNE